MSSILKAVKKVEQQKSARPRYDLDLASGIMRENTREKRRPWLIPAGMATVALVAVLSTYAIMAYHPGRPASGQLPSADGAPVPAASDVPAASTPKAPVAAVSPATAALQAPVAKKTEPARQMRAAASVQSFQAARPSVRQASLPAAQPPRNPSPVERRAEQSPAAPAIPKLKVTGIAWQKDGASRLAVVNGTAVSQGSVVGGARIEEILPDKVRFSAGGRTFEISIGKIQN